MVGVRKFVVMAMVVMLCVGLMAIPAYASQISQDGLDVVLTTDKGSYAQGETITETLTVRNTKDTTVFDLRLEIQIPAGYVPADDQSTVMYVETLEAGETAAFTVTFVEDYTKPGASADQDQTAEEAADTKSHEAQKKAYNVLFWLAAVGIFAIVILLAVLAKRIFVFVLCLCMVGAMLGGVPGQVSAAGSRPGAVDVETTITTGGEDVELGASVEYQPDPDGGSNVPLNLETDEVYFLTGQDYDVTFMVTSQRIAGQVALYHDEEQVAALRDDGTGGDAVAGDGVYSCVLTLQAEEARMDVYYAKAGLLTSDQVGLYYFEPLTEETVEQARAVYDRINSALQAIEHRYADASGYVTSEDVAPIMDEVAAYLAEVYADGDVVRYECSEAGAYIKLASGLTLMYEPTMESVSTGGSDVSLTFVSCQPNPDIENDMVRDQMHDIALEYQTRSASYTGPAVTLDLIKSMGSDQVIFWNGHGGYGPIVKSFLCSGEDFDWHAWHWDTTGYYWDCVRDRIICRSTKQQKDLACFTSNFVSHYCGDLSGDLLFLASCHSGRSSKLADAFRNKGASAVVGFTDSVYTGYCRNMGLYTLTYMTQINESTNDYYTLSEAMERAMDELGDTDLDYARQSPDVFQTLKAEEASPVIFGDGNYRYLHTDNGTLSGRICDASDRTTPIPGASITASWEDTTRRAESSDSNGNYTMNLPAGTFLVRINAPGYLEFKAYATVEANSNTYMETFLLIEESEEETGIASGTITNALTGSGLEGVTLEVRSGWNNADSGDVLATVTTDASGGYQVELPLGNYTLKAQKDGFVTAMVNIVVLPGTTGSQNGSMTPVLSGDEFRIVLTWGANPRDLDSHLLGSLSSGDAFHVYYRHKSQSDGAQEICNLDVDDTSSYGPETVTLKAAEGTAYYYYIHRYAGSGTVASSEAQVKVYQGDALAATFNVPTDQGSGDYWNVFAIVDGQLMVRGTMTSAPETSYAQAQ